MGASQKTGKGKIRGGGYKASVSVDADADCHLNDCLNPGNDFNAGINRFTKKGK